MPELAESEFGVARGSFMILVAFVLTFGFVKARAAKSAGVSCNTATAYSALPHEEIINAANENKCDLIFMASHGRHGLSRLLAGSVTQKVLADSTIPVLVLRPKAADHRPGSAQTQAKAS